MKHRFIKHILLLTVFIFLSACNDGKDQAELQSDTRSETRLQGQPNFRDIGGYLTSDGRKVKQGIVFRSGELPRLTENDVQQPYWQTIPRGQKSVPTLP